jgi:hypothetical protein
MVVERGRSEIEREWLREWIEHTSLCEPSEMDEERSRERERSLRGRVAPAWFESEQLREKTKKN